MGRTVRLGEGPGGTYLGRNNGTAVIQYDKDEMLGGTLIVTNAEDYQGEKFSFVKRYDASTLKKIEKYDSKIWQIVGEGLTSIKEMNPPPPAPVWNTKAGGKDAKHRVVGLMTTVQAMCNVLGTVLTKLPASPQVAGKEAKKPGPEKMALFNVFLPNKFRCFSYKTLHGVVEDILGVDKHHGYELPADF